MFFFPLIFLSLSAAAWSHAPHPAFPFSRKACVYEGKVLSPGSKFKPDPCTTCRCPRRGGGQVTCSVEDCRPDVHCLRYSNVTSRGSRSCCPLCVEQGCSHTDGHVYRRGEVISRDKCSKCYCPLRGGYSTCRVKPCPPLMCVDFVRRPGNCCPQCPHGSNCQLGMHIIRRGEVITSGDAFCRCHLKRRGDNFKLESVCYGSKAQGRQSLAETFKPLTQAGDHVTRSHRRHSKSPRRPMRA